MVKVKFDGRILEGKNIRRKIEDIANEMNFSGEDFESSTINLPKNYSQTRKIPKSHINF